MKQVININFQGRVIAIEVTAFEIVKEYIDKLKSHFSKEEGGDEIINDIEGRIGELFHERIKSGAACITDNDVHAVIASIGRPEQFDTDEEKSASHDSEKESHTAAMPRPRKLYRNEAEKLLGGVCSGLADYLNIDVVIVRIVFLIFFGPLILPYIIMWIVLPGTSTQTVGARTRKLFRDPDEKMIAGVCSGLGKYFGIDAWIPRVIFLLPLISFLFKWSDEFFFSPNFFKLTLSPGSLVVYLILWLVIPKARTTSEKLQMRGERVDLNTLQNKFTQGAKDFEKKAEKWGKEFSSTMQDRSQNMKAEVSEMAGKSKSGFGKVLGAIVKTIVYIILGFAAFIAFVIMLSLAVSLIAFFPLKDFLINTEWQNILAWGTLFLLVLLPVTATLIWIIRRIVRARSHSKTLRISFAGLWLVGILCGGLLAASIATEFRSKGKSEYREIALANPSAQSLSLVALIRDDNFINGRNFKIKSPEDIWYLDSFPLNNVHVKTIRSEDDRFRVFAQTTSFGRNRREAETRAGGISPIFASVDSTLQIDPRILITKKNKFRAQQLTITVHVPQGKKLDIDDIFVDRDFNIGSSEDYDDNSWGKQEIVL